MLLLAIDRLRFTLAFLREPRRWLMAGLAVAFGTIGVILADGFIERIFIDFREEVVRAHFGHLQIVPVDDASTGAGGALVVAQEPARAALDRAFPGAVLAARMSLVGLASVGERTVSFIAEGVEPDRERTLSSSLVVDRGRMFDRDDAREALVGEGLARNLGVAPGDTLTLLVNTRGGGVNAVDVQVSGIFYTATKAYDDRALRLPLRTAQQLVRSDELAKLVAVLPDSDDARRAVQLLEAELAGQAVRVRHWSELAEFYNKTVELFSRQLDVVRGVIIAIVLLSVANTMARNVMERTAEIGTMMALGRRRVAVARVFLAEGLAIGVVGGLAGLVAGWGLAIAISAIGIPMPAPPGMARGFIGGVAFTADIALIAFAVAVFTSVAASVLPAIRAARLDVVDALRTGR